MSFTLAPATMLATRFHRPTSIDEACALAQRLGASAAFLAGGTELIPDYQRGRETATDLIALEGIPALRGIAIDGHTIRIGALTTVASLAASSLVRGRLAALVEAARSLGSPQIRSRATVGGNFCRAVACADLPPAALVGAARLHVVFPGGAALIDTDRLFTGARRTALSPGDLLVEVVLPELPPATGTSFQRWSRRRGPGLAVASVAARVTLEPGGDRIADAAIALGAVAPVPMLVPDAAALLVGEPAGDSLFRLAAAACVRAAQPISDVRGSAGFRRELVEVLARRALETAVARARGEEMLT